MATTRATKATLTTRRLTNKKARRKRVEVEHLAALVVHVVGQLHRQTRATDVVFRKLVVVEQHHVLGEAGQAGITRVLLAGRDHSRDDGNDDGNDNTQNGHA